MIIDRIDITAFYSEQCRNSTETAVASGVANSNSALALTALTQMNWKNESLALIR